jgi:FixJ family two-component response regulator
MNGGELHRRLIASGHAIPTILMTAYPDDVGQARARKDGILCYLHKPLDENHLIECIRSALDGSRPVPNS